jgi:glycerol uptake facilitator-like aquaporin
MNTYYLIGIAMLIAGSYIRYIISKRRFNRTNHNGVQLFKSYRSSVFTTFTENFLRLLTTFMIIGGILVIAWGYRVNHINDRSYEQIMHEKKVK